LCIGLNFGKTHTSPGSSPEITQSAISEEALAAAPKLSYKLYDLNDQPVSAAALQAGQEFYAAVEIEQAGNLHGVSFTMDWMALNAAGARLKVVEEWAENGIQLSGLWGENALSLAMAFNEEGRLEIGASRTDGQGIDKDGELLRVKLRVVEAGLTDFSFRDIYAMNPAGEELVMAGNTLNKGTVPPAQVIAKQFSVGNYPNPFNPTTTISITLPVKTMVDLIIYNALGQEVVRLVKGEHLNAGSYEYNWDASSLPSGIYFYHLRTKEFTRTQKMMLLK
jgi:hypothetical protein